MAFKFDRRKDEEDELEEGEEEGKIDLKKKRIKDKEFKDLKAENRKARKEVIKSWGKKERIIVLVVFAFTTLVPAFLGMSSRRWKLPGWPKIGIPEWNLPDFSGQKLLLEDSGADMEKTKLAKNKFLDLTSDLTGVYALSVVRLKNGSRYGVNEDSKIAAASLIKLPVMAALLAEAEKGVIDLDSKHILKNEDKVGGSGSLSRKPSGYEITYRNLIELMGKQSDNTAFNIVKKTLGDEKVNIIIKKAGMVATSLNDNVTTATDISNFFESLWSGNLLGADAKYDLLDSLTDTIYESWLTAGIPESVKIAHKYGREVHVVNDAGIVFAEQPYIIVVLSEGVVDDEADDVLPQISKEIYEIEVNGNKKAEKF